MSSEGSNTSSNGEAVSGSSNLKSSFPMAYTVPTIRSKDDFIIEEKVGEGTYGKVFKARDKHTNQLVALKQIQLSTEKDGLPITAVREIKLLKSLRHENIVELKEIIVEPPSDPARGVESVYMVFEYMDHDLVGLVKSKGKEFVPGQIQCYIKQLLEGLYYCHNKKILHRDIKGANMLINNKGVLKLADFGLARKMHESVDGYYTNRVVTLWYRAPELLLGDQKYTSAIDLWSVGCILVELYRGYALFPGTSEADQLHKIFEICGTPTEESWPEAFSLPLYKDCKPKQNMPRRLKEFLGSSIDSHTFDLIDKLLALDPKKRITAEQALDHDYFFKPIITPSPSSLPQYQGSFNEMFWKRKRQEDKSRVHPNMVRDSGGNHQPQRQKYPEPNYPTNTSGGRAPYGYRNPEYRPPPRSRYNNYGSGNNNGYSRNSRNRRSSNSNYSRSPSSQSNEDKYSSREYSRDYSRDYPPSQSKEKPNSLPRERSPRSDTGPSIGVKRKREMS